MELKFSWMSLVDVLPYLLCLQAESALHKDYVVSQWQEQISEKKQVGQTLVL